MLNVSNSKFSVKIVSIIEFYNYLFFGDYLDFVNCFLMIKKL